MAPGFVHLPYVPNRSTISAYRRRTRESAVMPETLYDASHRLAVYGSLAPGQTNHHVVADIPGTWTGGTVEGLLSFGPETAAGAEPAVEVAHCVDEAAMGKALVQGFEIGRDRGIGGAVEILEFAPGGGEMHGGEAQNSERVDQG